MERMRADQPGLISKTNEIPNGDSSNKEMQKIKDELSLTICRYSDLVGRLESIKDRIHGPLAEVTTKSTDKPPRSNGFKNDLINAIDAMSYFNEKFEHALNQIDVF